jgi:hypothetical protein
VLGANVRRKLLGVDRATVIESIDFDEVADSVVVHVRPRRSTKRRCGLCGRRAPGYDQGVGRRNWRALDLGVLLCLLGPNTRCAIELRLLKEEGAVAPEVGGSTSLSHRWSYSTHGRPVKPRSGHCMNKWTLHVVTCGVWSSFRCSAPSTSCSC